MRALTQIWGGVYWDAEAETWLGTGQHVVYARRLNAQHPKEPLPPAAGRKSANV